MQVVGEPRGEDRVLLVGEVDAPAGLRVGRRGPPQSLIIDGSERYRSGRAEVIRGEVRNYRAGRVDRAFAIDRQRTVGHGGKLRILDAPGERNESIGDDIIGRHQPERVEAVRADEQIAIRRGRRHAPAVVVAGAAGQVPGEGIGPGRRPLRGHQRVSVEQVFAVVASRLVQHDVLDLAVGVGEYLLDPPRVIAGQRRGRRQERHRRKHSAHSMLHRVLLRSTQSASGRPLPAGRTGRAPDLFLLRTGRALHTQSKRHAAFRPRQHEGNMPLGDSSTAVIIGRIAAEAARSWWAS